MSILIKGMELPKDCEECRFCIGLADTEWGACAGCLIDNEYREASSKSGCPLVEIPEPHGDLIDRDALRIAELDTLIMIRYKLAYAPTVIEAEGSED